MPHSISSEHKTELRQRLNRLEGQVRGVSKMIEDERSCQEIIQQLAAIRSAAQQASLLVARTYAHECLMHTTGNARPPESVIDDLISMLSKAS